MNPTTKIPIVLNTKISTSLGTEAAFYYGILEFMFDRVGTEELHIAHVQFQEFTNDSQYKIQTTLGLLEQNKLIERIPNGHGNVNRYKLNRNAIL